MATVNRLDGIGVGALRTDSTGRNYRVDSVVRKHGRHPNLLVSGRCVDTEEFGNYCYELAYDTEVVVAEPEKEESMTDPKITPDVVKALATIRNQPGRTSDEALANIVDAFDVLDNAGIFAAIDEATGYDIDPEAERVSKCTCPPSYLNNNRGRHQYGCPGDPAEWGDMAYTEAPETVPCDHCRGDFSPKKDGSLRKHDCRRYNQEAKTIVYGPLDIHERKN